MLYEFRTYRLGPGLAPDYLARFVARGLPALSHHLPMLGYWLTETGRANTLHHLWAYRDWSERAARRAGLAQDAGWAAFVAEGFALIREQESVLLEAQGLSPALAAALAGRDSRHVPPAPGAALMAAEVSAFEWHDRPCAADTAGPASGSSDPGTLALWRVVSGALSPGWLRLTARAPLPPQPLPGALRHEIVRPLALSPL
ncbi:NIPSNAP family protein [Frigidibacter sp. MR17.14]|uniref:NIPSNAP family protein n=1 Tax=Frigidibacter sp. MR17.14 TaxID=3126509 RepID=UPI003012C995